MRLVALLLTLIGASPGDHPALVGSGGEVYRWDEGAWRRLPGGVAGELKAALGVGAEIWAVGRRVFRHDGTSWNAVPEAGRATVAASPGSTVPGVAQGRTIRLRVPGRWATLPALPDNVTAFWAVGLRDVWAITPTGASRWNGRTWRAVAGTTGATAVGAGLILGDGVWRGGKRLAGAESLAGRPRFAASTGGRTYVLFTGALARVEGGALVLVAPTPPDAGEPAAFFARGEDLVLAGRNGQVWSWREGWREESVTEKAPVSRPGPAPGVAR